MSTISEQIEQRKKALKAELARLDTPQISLLEMKRAEHERTIREIDEQLEALAASLGINGYAKKASPGTSSSHGILVSVNRLKEIFAELGVKELSVRMPLPDGRKLDAKCIKTLAAQHPDVFQYVSAGPWPVVKLR